MMIIFKCSVPQINDFHLYEKIFWWFSSTFCWNFHFINGVSHLLLSSFIRTAIQIGIEVTLKSKSTNENENFPNTTNGTHFNCNFSHVTSILLTRTWNSHSFPHRHCPILSRKIQRWKAKWMYPERKTPSSNKNMFGFNNFWGILLGNTKR